MSFHDRAETLLVRALLGFFGAMKPETASNLGGWVMGHVGPLLPTHQVALDNLRHAFPELSEQNRRRIARASWQNLGRVLAELVHLPRIVQITESGPGMELRNGEVITQIHADPAPAIFFAAHLANWEILLPQGNRMGGEIAGVFRAPQRQGVTNLLVKMRHLAAGHSFPLFPKGARGARDALAYLRKGGKLGLLMDQKMNDGIAVPFFGRPAMTAPALARFALRFRCAVVPFHAERIGPARYRMVGEPPLTLPDSGDLDQDVLTLTTEINRLIETWVRARPGEWLWIHRRWPREGEEKEKVK